MSPRVPGSHNDYKSPEKARVDRVRGTKSVFESAIWIAINNEQEWAGAGPWLRHCYMWRPGHQWSLMRGGGGHWTHWACGCLSRMFECLTREYFCRIYEWAVNDRGCCIPSSSWILPLNFTQMAPTPGKPFILTWLITNFRECSEFLLCSRADIKEPDCSFWDQGDSFSSLWMNAWAFSEKGEGWYPQYVT